jgi:hypothetical protein
MMDSNSYRNQIFLVGRHRVIREYVDSYHPVYIDYITSSQSAVIAGCCTTKDTCPREARKWWRGEGGTGVWWGDLMRDTPFCERSEAIIG